MARHKLENELIAIEVEEHGAELKSLVRKNTGKEYMWKADPKFWGRTSPVLFPFVGAVKEKQFRTKGQTYTMGQHGFARDMDFTLDSKTEDTLWFVLQSNEETMEKYPYAFTLRIGYHIEGNKLEVLWQVEILRKRNFRFRLADIRHSTVQRIVKSVLMWQARSQVQQL